MDTTLTLTNPFSKEQLIEGIQSWPNSFELCQRRAGVFKSFRQTLHTTSELRTKTLSILQDTEKDITTLEPLLREPTEVEKEGYNQVCFTGNPWSGLNSVPFALIILSIYKSYIVPAFGLLLPLLSWILPYILIKAFYNIPITFTEYTKILWRMWNGQPMPRTPQDLMNPPPELVGSEQNAFTRLKTLGQNGWTLFTVGQAMWQPIQQAKHFMKLDTSCHVLGTALLRVKENSKFLLNGWRKYLPQWFPEWVELCPSSTVREAFAFAYTTPFWLRHTLRALGRFEVLFRLADRDDVVDVKFIQASKPILHLKEFGDPAIPMEKRITSNVFLGGEKASHAIVTGPNRGGKSSFLRGIYTNICMAHAFGAAFAGAATMTPFTWIANGLGLADLPGEQSMFEREVAFASGVIQKQSKGGFGLVLYDELFHSTNPPDAKRTSELFCDKLWKKEGCLSILSTHVYSLAREAPPNVKQLCVAAWKSPTGRYTFSYTIQKGICEVSSVDLLLKQFNLL
jgi:hypothetical protein